MSWFSNARDVLRTLAHSKGCERSIQNDQLMMVPHASPLPDDAIVVNSTTGMIGMPVETPGGIIVRTLINSKIGVYSQIQVNESDIQRAQLTQENNNAQANDQINRLGTSDGTYKVLYIERKGDTRGQEWYQDLTCIGAITGAPPDALTQKLPATDTSAPSASTPGS